MVRPNGSVIGLDSLRGGVGAFIQSLVAQPSAPSKAPARFCDNLSIICGPHNPPLDSTAVRSAGGAWGRRGARIGERRVLGGLRGGAFLLLFLRPVHPGR